MRRFKPKQEQFSLGTRSDSNGPVQYAKRPQRFVFGDSDITLDIPYKVVKPYISVQSSVTATYRESDDIDVGTLPDISSIVFHLLDGHTDPLTSLFSSQIDVQGAINGALENSQAYGELLLLVTISEAKQTVRMIRTVFIRVFNIILDIYKAVKKLNVVATLDIITDVWLEYRYGWRPLIGEIGSIHKALTVERPNGIKSSFGTGKTDSIGGSHSRVINFFNEDTGLFVDYDLQFEFVDTTTVKTGFNYLNKQGSRNDDWSAIFGLDWASLASTAWEVVPFSFMIDMFLNIGNMLQARDVTDQVDSFNGYMTFRSYLNATATVIKVSGTKAINLDDVFTESEKNTIRDDPTERLKLSLFYIQDRIQLFNWASYSTRQSGGSVFHHSSRASAKAAIEAKANSNLPTEASPEWVNYTLFDELLKYVGFSQGRSGSYDGFDINFYHAIRKLHLLGSRVQIVYSFTVDSLGRHNATFNKYVTWVLSDDKQFVPEDGEGNPLQTSGSSELLQRFKLDEFSHEFTADADLSTGQIADLTAFAFKLGLFFKNKL